MICSFSCECFGTMHPFLRYTCASIIRSPVIRRRSSIGETVSRGIWSQEYQVQERSVDSVIVAVAKVADRETYAESEGFVRQRFTQRTGYGVRRLVWRVVGGGRWNDVAAVSHRAPRAQRPTKPPHPHSVPDAARRTPYPDTAPRTPYPDVTRSSY